MKLQHLFEKHDLASEPYIEKVCKLLFNRVSPGAVEDTKRKGEFFGVSNTLSVITDKDGNHLTLTFDNSTASGEFELNSLAPLEIVKGGPMDSEIKQMYKEHDLKSAKKLGYIEKSGELVLREIHFGKMLDENAINFCLDLIVVLKQAGSKKSKTK